MATPKKPVLEPIKRVVVGELQFDRVYANISKENRLVKCPNSACDRLISKVSSDGLKTLQHRKLRIIVEGEVIMSCPHCGTVVSFK